MKTALAITGVAAAATLTLGGLTAEPAMAAKGRKHGNPAAVRAHRQMRPHHRQNRRIRQVRRSQHVIKGPGWGAVYGPGYGGGGPGLTVRF